MALVLAAPGGLLSQIVVVPEFWKGLRGDDWLNNASTRDEYGRHVEHQLEREIEDEVARVRSQAAQDGLRHECRIVLGKPADCLLELAATIKPDLVLIGSPRPAGSGGLRSRMLVEKLTRGLVAPLLIVPHPG